MSCSSSSLTPGSAPPPSTPTPAPATSASSASNPAPGTSPSWVPSIIARIVVSSRDRRCATQRTIPSVWQHRPMPQTPLVHRAGPGAGADFVPSFDDLIASGDPELMRGALRGWLARRDRPHAIYVYEAWLKAGGEPELIRESLRGWLADSATSANATTANATTDNAATDNAATAGNATADDNATTDNAATAGNATADDNATAERASF